MDFQITADGISALGNLLTGIAAAAAAIQGIKSLSAWRAEAVGRRRFEVAEDVLTTFYTIQDIIFQSRAPLVLGGEMVPEEGIEDSIATDANYAPLRRLSRHQHVISELRTKRHVFAALFGKENTKPFDDIERVILDIRTAVEALLDGKRMGLPTRGEPDYEFYQDMRRIIFRFPGKEKDTITPLVEKVVKEVERICEPVIQARLPK